VVFLKEVADDVRLLLAATKVRAGVRDHLGLITRPLPAHGLLCVLVEHLVGIELGAVARHEAEFEFRSSFPLGIDPAGNLRRLVSWVGVDDEDDLPAVRRLQELPEEPDEDISVEAAGEHHEPESAEIADGRDHAASEPATGRGHDRRLAPQ